MALSAKERKQLVAESHRLKPVATVSPEALSEAVVAHVRAAFASQALIKVRISADNAAEAEAAATELAGRVPCELVKRIGHVVLLYRAREERAGNE